MGNTRLVATSRPKVDFKRLYLKGYLVPFSCLQVQSGRSVRQKETGRRAMKLLRLIIEIFLEEGDGAGDWRFCFLASSILAHITMNNETIGEGF